MLHACGTGAGFGSAAGAACYVVATGRHGVEPKPAPVPQACSIGNPDCEACQ